MAIGGDAAAVRWAARSSTDGTPLEGKVELWNAGPDGAFEIARIRQAPYQITDGSCRKLIAAAGWL